MNRILLVEDNDVNREMLERRLQRRGFEVILATNGKEAVDQTTSERPDLVLMDMSLPVLDGWEATSRIKGNPELRQIPVVALTAHAMVGDRERVLQAGCDDYVTKPVDFEKLLEVMKKLLSKGAL